MAVYIRIGIPFNIIKDWKKLFVGGNEFVYQERTDADKTILRELSLLNVFKWYFYQLVIAILMRLLRPLALIACHYWWEVEGKDFREITNTSIKSLSEIRFFRLK